MYNIKQSRNHCAHELGVDDNRDQPIFAKIRQSYIALLALLDVLSGKVKAAIEDEDAWVKDELDAWTKEDSWVTEHPFAKMRQCEYAQEPPEVEVMLMAQEQKRELEAVEYEAFKKAAELAWANKEPGTEQYDAEWKYIHYAWLEAQGIELDEWVDEYPSGYEEDSEHHRPMIETPGRIWDDSDEETTSEQDETTAEASGRIQDECTTEGSEW